MNEQPESPQACAFQCSVCGEVSDADPRMGYWQCCYASPSLRFDAVESTNVHSIGYNADTSELHVRFKSKDAPTHYVYAAVPHATYEALLRADSVGKYFAAFVKNQYGCAKVEA